MKALAVRFLHAVTRIPRGVDAAGANQTPLHRSELTLAQNFAYQSLNVRKLRDLIQGGPP
ncbi:hypothetical protein EGN72_10565 [Pseudorhodobacter sp. E13]|uniref:hypothetical protein n=1 Tax=Pseudorhodobacter sp. E13 TaxID=2487931 RepID=UPI000F96FC03|nr:hypothetical protein [Pseudorhodobacter sp. E13]RUS60227.1 hypothetical protein EGN72_10565 [Pseudorhodobacter sp. E13]